MAKKKPRGYWRDWKNVERELKQAMRELGHFPTYRELQKMGKSSLCYIMTNHHGGLIEVRRRLGEETGKRKIKGYRRENRFFNKLEDSDIVRYISDNHKGLKISELEREDPSFVNAIRERGLMDNLVEEGILVRKIKPVGFFSRMSDDEMIAYVQGNYAGIGITVLEKESCALVIQLRKRGLAEGLFEEGILIRKRLSVSPLRYLSDNEFTEYLRENHYGETRTQLAQGSKTAYREIQRRNLADKLIQEGILVNRDKGVGKGFFTRMNDEQLEQYLIENCTDMTLKEASKTNSRAYQLACERGIVDKLVKDGVLIRKGFRLEKINGSDAINILRDYVSGGNKNE